MMMTTTRSPAQDIPDIYWEQAARELDFCTCRKCQVSHPHLLLDDVLVDDLVDDDHSPSFCHHGTYQQVDNNLDSEKSTQMTNHHNSRPATGHALIIPMMILIIIWQIVLRIIIPMIILINILLLISKDNSNVNNSNGNNSNYNCRLAIGNTLKRRRTVRLQMTQPSRIPSFPWRPRSDYFQFMIDYLEWIICSIIFRPKDFMRISWMHYLLNDFPLPRSLSEFLEWIIFWMIFPSIGLYAIIWIFMQLFWTIFPPNKGLHARDHDGRNGLLQPYVNRRSLIASSKAKYIILQTASVSWTL